MKDLKVSDKFTQYAPLGGLGKCSPRKVLKYYIIMLPILVGFQLEVVCIS